MKRMIAVALLVVAIVFVSAGPSLARGEGGHGSPGGRPGAQLGNQHQSPVRPNVQHFRGVAPHRGFYRGDRGRFFVGVAPLVVGPAFAYGWSYAPGYAPDYASSPPVYAAPQPSYWYYCQSAGAYYPDVQGCPEAWIPVPAQ